MFSSHCTKDAQYRRYTGSTTVWKKPLVVAESEEASGNSGRGHFGQGLAQAAVCENME